MIDENKLKNYRDELKRRTFKCGGSSDLMLVEDFVHMIDKYLDKSCTEDKLLFELSNTCIPDENETNWLCSNNNNNDEITTDKCIECWRRYLE